MSRSLTHSDQDLFNNCPEPLELQPLCRQVLLRQGLRFGEGHHLRGVRRPGQAWHPFGLAPENAVRHRETCAWAHSAGNFYPSSQTLYTVIGEQLALTLSYVISLGHQVPHGAAERPLLCGGLVQISIPSWGQPIQRRGLPARGQARWLHPGRSQPIRFAIKALEDWRTSISLHTKHNALIFWHFFDTYSFYHFMLFMLIGFKYFKWNVLQYFPW